MSKARPFSIYLLKEGYTSDNSLKANHGLKAADATKLPENSALYILNSTPKPPWWKDYFGVEEQLLQLFKGALVFLPVKDRWFVLSFGQVSHHLNDNAHEYDFGLRVTLNSLDPKALKSADMVAPGAARRKRTQVPISTELTYLDFDGNSEIIKSLTGKVKPKYAELFKNATGSESLKVSLKIDPDGLIEICDTLLTLYSKEDFKTAFPNIQNISPVKDPADIDRLDEKLLQSLCEGDSRATLTIPDIVDYRDNTCCIFSGNGHTSNIYPDISLEQFYEFLGEGFDRSQLTIPALKSYRMILTDVHGFESRSYSIYRSLYFDLEPADEQAIYHFCEGNWYKAEKSYVERLKKYIDQKCEEGDLCPYNHDDTASGKSVYSESNYNSAIPKLQEKILCLDKTDISPAGNTAIEPCDLYTIREDESAANKFRGLLYHVKISTRSTHLSHLFNQGVNSIELIKGEEVSLAKMKRLIAERLAGNDKGTYLAPFEKYDLKVIFGIITHKPKEEKSANLPLFSKISLMRSMQRLDLYGVPSALIFIEDKSPKKEGHTKCDQIAVEICVGPKGNEVRPVPGQNLDPNQPIKGCPKEVRESAVGARYILAVKISADDQLSSYHGWPYKLVPDNHAVP